jgi:hypothetical protein
MENILGALIFNKAIVQIYNNSQPLIQNGEQALHNNINTFKHFSPRRSFCLLNRYLFDKYIELRPI